MRIIQKPSFEILTDISPNAIEELQRIEAAGRVCYKTENKMDSKALTARQLVSNFIAWHHESPLEHSNLSVKFITDRGVTHELVRHRVASYSQESTRYCNYSKNKFDHEITVVKPHDISGVNYDPWKQAMEFAEASYFQLLDAGVKPETARSVLPTCLKTEIVVSANYREWRHILDLRTSSQAQPDIRYLMLDLLDALYNKIPIIFDDIYILRTSGRTN